MTGKKNIGMLELSSNFVCMQCLILYINEITTYIVDIVQQQCIVS